MICHSLALREQENLEFLWILCLGYFLLLLSHVVYQIKMNKFSPNFLGCHGKNEGKRCVIAWWHKAEYINKYHSDPALLNRKIINKIAWEVYPIFYLYLPALWKWSWWPLSVIEACQRWLFAKSDFLFPFSLLPICLRIAFPPPDKMKILRSKSLFQNESQYPKPLLKCV